MVTLNKLRNNKNYVEWDLLLELMTLYKKQSYNNKQLINSGER